MASSSSSSSGDRPDAAASVARAAESQASTGADYPEATGVLLLGGASRRFGSAKALARYGSETLAERAWRILGEAFTHRLAVGKTRDALELPFPLVDDGTDVRAPLAGIVAGLYAAETDICVFVPVDVPLVTAAALRALASACRAAAVPPTGPLPGAYRRSTLPVFERRLRAHELKLRDALRELEVASVDIDAAELVNVNEPEDLDRFPR